MPARNSLVDENLHLIKDMQKDNDTFLHFLETCAKFPCQNLQQQLSLSLYAPKDAKAVASEDFWKRFLHSNLAEGANPISVPVQKEDGTWETIEFYDVSDTERFQQNAQDSIFHRVPWTFEAKKDGAFISESLSYTAENLDAAIDDYCRRYALRSNIHSDEKLLAESIKYATRTRLGLSVDASVVTSISREGQRMELFLQEMRAGTQEILDLVRSSLVVKEKQEEEAKEHEEQRRLEEVRDTGRDSVQTVAEGRERNGNSRETVSERNNATDGAVGRIRRHQEDDATAQGMGSDAQRGYTSPLFAENRPAMPRERVEGTGSIQQPVGERTRGAHPTNGIRGREQRVSKRVQRATRRRAKTHVEGSEQLNLFDFVTLAEEETRAQEVLPEEQGVTSSTEEATPASDAAEKIEGKTSAPENIFLDSPSHEEEKNISGLEKNPEKKSVQKAVPAEELRSMVKSLFPDHHTSIAARYLQYLLQSVHDAPNIKAVLQRGEIPFEDNVFALLREQLQKDTASTEFQTLAQSITDNIYKKQNLMLSVYEMLTDHQVITDEAVQAVNQEPPAKAPVSYEGKPLALSSPLMQMSIRDWYQATRPFDSLGERIRDVTFRDFFSTPRTQEDSLAYLGLADLDKDAGFAALDFLCQKGASLLGLPHSSVQARMFNAQAEIVGDRSPEATIESTEKFNHALTTFQLDKEAGTQLLYGLTEELVNSKAVLMARFDIDNDERLLPDRYLHAIAQRYLTDVSKSPSKMQTLAQKLLSDQARLDKILDFGRELAERNATFSFDVLHAEKDKAQEIPAEKIEEKNSAAEKTFFDSPVHEKEKNISALEKNPPAENQGEEKTSFTYVPIPIDDLYRKVKYLFPEYPEPLAISFLGFQLSDARLDSRISLRLAQGEAIPEDAIRPVLHAQLRKYARNKPELIMPYDFRDIARSVLSDDHKRWEVCNALGEMIRADQSIGVDYMDVDALDNALNRVIEYVAEKNPPVENQRAESTQKAEKASEKIEEKTSVVENNFFDSPTHGEEKNISTGEKNPATDEAPVDLYKTGLFDKSTDTELRDLQVFGVDMDAAEALNSYAKILQDRKEPLDENPLFKKLPVQKEATVLNPALLQDFVQMSQELWPEQEVTQSLRDLSAFASTVASQYDVRRNIYPDEEFPLEHYFARRLFEEVITKTSRELPTNELGYSPDLYRKVFNVSYEKLGKAFQFSFDLLQNQKDIQELYAQDKDFLVKYYLEQQEEIQEQAKTKKEEEKNSAPENIFLDSPTQEKEKNISERKKNPEEKSVPASTEKNNRQERMQAFAQEWALQVKDLEGILETYKDGESITFADDYNAFLQTHSDVTKLQYKRRVRDAIVQFVHSLRAEENPDAEKTFSDSPTRAQEKNNFAPTNNLVHAEDRFIARKKQHEQEAIEEGLKTKLDESLDSLQKEWGSDFQRISDNDASESESPQEDKGMTEAKEELQGVDLAITKLGLEVDEISAGLDYDADMSTTRGKREVFKRNLAAIRLVKEILSRTDPKDTSLLPFVYEKGIVPVLKSYAGWGGMPEVFDERNAGWKREREALQKVLSEEEYAAARASTLNAHYTPPEVIQAIYQGLQQLGFEGGTILDPAAGTGRFFTNMPDYELWAEDKDYKENHPNARAPKAYGVELDDLTAQIAQEVMPENMMVENKGFEEVKFGLSYFDLAITNVPFGNYVIEDEKRKGYLVHDFFALKMLDEVRAGGYAVVVTSKGTMDKKDSKARREIAKVADLVSAVRLPNSVFKGAGTEAVADILIFKKRDEKRTPEIGLPSWVEAKEAEIDGQKVSMNSYFLEHPEAVLGQNAMQSSAHGQALTVLPTDALQGKKLLNAITQGLSQTDEKLHYKPREDNDFEEALTSAVFSPSREEKPHPFGFYESDDGELFYLRANGQRQDISRFGFRGEKTINRVRAAMRIRDVVRAMLDAESEGCSDDTLKQYQEKLREAYDAYEKEYGKLRSTDKRGTNELGKVFNTDASFSLLTSLENPPDENGVITLADIFTKRTVYAHAVPSSAETNEEALMISLQETGGVSPAFMARLRNLPPEQVLADLEEKGRIFFDIESKKYVTSEEYLSGNIREKIDKLHESVASQEKALIEAATNALYPSVQEKSFKEIEEAGGRAIEIFQKVKPKPWYETDEGKEYLNHGGAEELCKHPEQLAYLLSWGTGGYKRNLFNALRQAMPNRTVDFADDPEFTLSLMAQGVWNLDYAIAPEGRRDEQTAASFFDSVISRNLHLFIQETAQDGINRAFLLQYAQGRAPTWKHHQRMFGKVDQDLHLPQTEDLEAFRKDALAKIENRAHTDTNLFEGAGEMQDEINFLQKNLQALESVKPKDLTPEEIHVTLGAPWIPVEYINAFIKDTFVPNVYVAEGVLPHVEYSRETGTWKIENKIGLYGNPNNEKVYAVGDKTGIELLECALNLREPKIFIKNEEGKRVLDAQKTAIARQKITDFRDAFSKWILKDKARAQHMADNYNHKFRSIVPREYDGSHLTFSGMNPEIKLRKHQKDAVARILYGGNTLLAHAVGAGKTYEMQAAAMESKRVGLCKKSLMIMPKHLTEQFGAEFLQLYPNAKVLVATERDFDKMHRQEFLAKIASNEWDAVVMSYEQFGKVPLSYENHRRFLKEQSDRLREALAQDPTSKRRDKYRSYSVKEIEKRVKQIETEIRALDKKHKTADQVVTFEQLGVDRLFVDEAHNFKNLFINTQMQDFPNNAKVQKTFDMLEKVQYLNEKTHEHGVIFATGTPISNSLAEMYTMQRYLKPSELASTGLDKSFDSWATTFARPVTTVEVNPEGSGFRAKQRLAKFQNLPELLNMYREFADVQTKEMLNLPAPKMEAHIVESELSPTQAKIMEEFSARADKIRANQPEKVTAKDGHEYDDNMLAITNEGRKLAIDPRLLNPDLPEEPNSKIAKCAQNVAQIYKDTAEKHLTQVVFCDLGTPKKDGTFSVYDDLKQKLMLKGVKEKEIAFIHDYPKPEQKQALFDKVQKGEVRVLIGSSEKLGVGTNIQNKLIAMHELDCPWKPSQIAQRMGRIERQGNENAVAHYYRYVTKDSFESYMWQTNERKQGFISQVETGSVNLREAEDVDETTLEFKTIKAICSGDARVKEQFNLEQEISLLQEEKKAYQETIAKLERKVHGHLPKAIEEQKDIVARYEADLATLKENNVGLSIKEKVYQTKKDIGEVLANCAKAIMKAPRGTRFTGAYHGLKLFITRDEKRQKAVATLAGKASHAITLASTAPESNADHIFAIPLSLEGSIRDERKALQEMQTNLEVAKESLAKPFPKDDLLAKKEQQLKKICALIESSQKAKEGEKKAPTPLPPVKKNAGFTR